MKKVIGIFKGELNGNVMVMRLEQRYMHLSMMKIG